MYVFSFNISLDQIYTITTDNGANMLKAVRILDEDCDDILEQNEESEDNTNNNIDCDIYLEKDEKDDETDETDYLNVFENIESDDINTNFQNNILTLTGKELLN